MKISLKGPFVEIGSPQSGEWRFVPNLQLEINTLSLFFWPSINNNNSFLVSASWALTECSTFSSVGPSFVKEGCISFAMAPTESEIQFHSSCFRWLQAWSLKLRRDSESEAPGWPEATYKIPWEIIINFSLKPLLSEWFVLLSYITGTSACAKLHSLYCPYIMNHRWNQRAYASSSTCLWFWNFWNLCILLSFIYLYLDLSPDSELISQNIKTQEKLDSFVVYSVICYIFQD